VDFRKEIIISTAKMLLQEYQRSWADDFTTIKNILAEVFTGLDISIEHVGSTAIPGLAAKPIIDIDIVYYKQKDFEAIKEKLQTIGYYHNGNQGIPNREVFKRNVTTQKHNVLDVITHHLYACPADSEELQRHLLFKDYLLNNEEERTYYQSLKYKIAEEAGQDRKKYAALKEVKAKEFINTIIEKAKANRK
jgi:GrpB-like predicted nucleotidyltransferase (UPF0157 family)